jgi:hypothetical protein
MLTQLDTQLTVMYGIKKYSANIFPAVYCYNVTRLNFEERFVQLRSNTAGRIFVYQINKSSKAQHEQYVMFP